MTNISKLPSLTKHKENCLRLIGLDHIEDVLFVFPKSYEDETHLQEVCMANIKQPILVDGKVEKTRIIYGRRRTLLVLIQTPPALLRLRFFHFNNKQRKEFERGRRLTVFGELRYHNGFFEIIHPRWRFYEPCENIVLKKHLTSIYPAVEGLSSHTFSKIVGDALTWAESNLEHIRELLPHPLEVLCDGLTLPEALKLIHRPPPTTDYRTLQNHTHPVFKRLIIEELMAHVIHLRQNRVRSDDASAYSITSGESVDALLESLPFKLTNAQIRVFGEIRQDMEKKVPMMRLLQGEVGSGKTIVAILALYLAAKSGMQSACMVPTEILAQQHYATVRSLLEPRGFHCDLLLGGQSAKEKKEVLSRMSRGETDVVIGTHSLFQKQVALKKLGFVIIDEQHRFGVHQRLLLCAKGEGVDDIFPHQLVMTATPIPRTLAMAAYAALDYSTIDCLPDNRKQVSTVAMPNERRDEIIQKIRLVSTGQQAFWICTLIGESKVLQCQNALQCAQDLQKRMPELVVACLHGELDNREKQQILENFRNKKTSILVSTTVVEVGIDIPDATFMIIENAERLGLSQLHQLRGRVGRGGQQGYCVLLYQGPLSERAFMRINVLRETCDGFAIARKDLEIRGAGEFYGTNQSGQIDFQFANLTKDAKYLPLILRHADACIRNTPNVAKQLKRRWLQASSQYTKV